MNKFLWLFCLFTFVFHFSSASILSGTNAAAWKRHCAAVTKDPALFIKKLAQTGNRLSFTNHGGLFNGGVCWWHSRLTRAAQYLAVFDPSQLPVTDDEAYELIQRLRDGRPVTINGFENLNAFSKVHYRSIQENLENWQISNGGFGFGFIDGLRGSSSVPAAELKSMMDATYSFFTRSQKPVYQVLQLAGVTAHSWLVIDMQPSVNGYVFSVVDSNYHNLQKWKYANGDIGFKYFATPFVNYTTKRALKEDTLLSKRLNEACISLETKGKLTDAPMTIDEELELLMGPPTN